MVWYSHIFQNFPQFVEIHTVKSFSIVTEAEIALFLKFSCFFNDPMDVKNFISGSCAFSKTEYIMRNTGLDEAQAGIKIAGRNISNLRYADDTTLMAESKEELKGLLMKVKEESGNFGLNLSI